MLRSLCALLLVSSALSAPRQLAEDHGHVLVEITSDKSTSGKSGIPTAIVAIWAGTNPPITGIPMPTVTDTSTGYKAEVEPPTGKTAKEMVDALPKGAGDAIKTTLNNANADLKVTAVAICVEPSDGSSCPSGGGGGGGDDPCFSREAEACRIVDTSVAPFAAFRACFDEAAPSVAERVKMTALTGGDYILSAGKDQAYEFTRVIVNQHKLTEKRSSMLKIAHADGEIELTPDHVLLVDGQWAPAHTVKVGSSLSGSKVTAISHGVGGIINPVTVSGMIVAAGATGGPVISSAYPEWIAEYMLEHNNGYYPLPVSMSSMLAYLFPATVQAYWDEVLEHAFAANQKALNAIPTPFVAPIMFVLDLVCSAGLLLFALANAKVIATLVAVVAVARARRVAKA